nr:hypothetical protein [Acaryochloris sp. CCMEE 5410]
MLPVIVISSFVSFLLTSQIAMIKTQRSRELEGFPTSAPQTSEASPRLVSSPASLAIE